MKTIYNSDFDLLTRALLELKDSRTADNKWIIVKDRLPEDKQRVLIFVPENNVYGYDDEIESVNVAVFDRDVDDCWNNKKPYDWKDSGKTYFGQEVTPWMPLPKPPKGDNE